MAKTLGAAMAEIFGGAVDTIRETIQDRLHEEKQAAWKDGYKQAVEDLNAEQKDEG